MALRERQTGVVGNERLFELTVALVVGSAAVVSCATADRVQAAVPPTYDPDNGGRPASTLTLTPDEVVTGVYWKATPTATPTFPPMPNTGGGNIEETPGAKETGAALIPKIPGGGTATLESNNSEVQVVEDENTGWRFGQEYAQLGYYGYEFKNKPWDANEAWMLGRAKGDQFIKVTNTTQGAKEVVYQKFNFGKTESGDPIEVDLALGTKGSLLKRQKRTSGSDVPWQKNPAPSVEESFPGKVGEDVFIDGQVVVIKVLTTVPNVKDPNNDSKH